MLTPEKSDEIMLNSNIRLEENPLRRLTEEAGSKVISFKLSVLMWTFTEMRKSRASAVVWVSFVGSPQASCMFFESCLRTSKKQVWFSVRTRQKYEIYLNLCSVAKINCCEIWYCDASWTSMENTHKNCDFKQTKYQHDGIPEFSFYNSHHSFQ
jgi:hypothetical protein